LRGEVLKMTAEQNPFDLLNEAVDELKKIDPQELAGEAVIAASRDKILQDLQEGWPTWSAYEIRLKQWRALESS
jgi:hypothetical protein